jgi:hypothetical protein
MSATGLEFLFKENTRLNFEGDGNTVLSEKKLKNISDSRMDCGRYKSRA